MTDFKVTVDTFACAETDRMFEAIMETEGLATNEWAHNRVPTPLDKQPVIRQNRDTLYSAAIVDISEGATLTLPDAGDRYISAMVVNQDHYINDVLHDRGEHELSVDRFDTPFVLLGVRILVDPDDHDDVTTVTALQDQLRVASSSAASAGGGLPEYEAYYQNVVPGLPVGAYSLTVRDAPLDGFWSVSLYHADGGFPTTSPRTPAGASTSTTSPPSGLRTAR